MCSYVRRQWGVGGVRGTHPLVHGWQVPDVADEGPARHHSEQIVDHAVLGAVPKSVSKLWVILQRCREERIRQKMTRKAI